ncbi:hypothetical protein BGX28_005308 [Mortierella sp. GBA30]|nr:hypothetical protein BGX28_005308 [Mortierella sp. GBA30]
MASIQEKMTAALANKDLGNESFKKGDIKQGLTGLDNQMSGVPMMSAMRPQDGAASDDQKNEIKTNLAVVYSNMGACHLKNANFKRAIEVCNTALKHDPNNVKAKFRRAQAKLGEGNLAGAEADLHDLGEKVPGVKAELEKLKKKSKEADEKQRKTMGGFLSRGRIISEDEEEEESTSKQATTHVKTASKSKPVASKVNQVSQTRKPKPMKEKEDEYRPTSTWSGTAPNEEEFSASASGWSGTAPKIQELADGEE